MTDVIAIVGLPGSGKTRLMRRYASQGYHPIDELQVGWPESLLPVVEALARSQNLAVVSSEFCEWKMRWKFEVALGLPIQWLYFANDPYRCARNVIYRHYFVERPWTMPQILADLERLTLNYDPPATALPIVLADEEEAQRRTASALRSL